MSHYHVVVKNTQALLTFHKLHKPRVSVTINDYMHTYIHARTHTCTHIHTYKYSFGEELLLYESSNQ